MSAIGSVIPDPEFRRPMKRIPSPFQAAPTLDATYRPVTIQRRHALLINPFYRKDPHASFGKHVLTPTLALSWVALTCLGVWAADGAELAFGRKDDGRIVIDEVVGQLITLSPLGINPARR